MDFAAGVLCAWVLYGVILWLCAVSADRMMKKFLLPRPGRLWRIVRYAAMMLSIGVIIYIGDPVNILFALPLTFLFLFLSFRGTRTERLALCMLYDTLTSCISAAADAIYFSGSPLLDPAVLVRLGLWLVVALAVWRLLPEKKYHLPEKMWRLIATLSLLPFVGIIVAVALVEPRYAGGGLASLVLMPFFLLSALAVLYTAAVLARQERLEQEAGLLRMNQSYYAQLEQQQRQVRSLRHDMANHFTVLGGLLEMDQTEEARQYLERLKGQPGLLSTRQFCEHPVVNTVLNAKAAAMAEQKIPLRGEIHVEPALPLDGPELGALLGNILDNAVEACARLPREERWISLKLEGGADRFSLCCENPCARAPAELGGRLISSKRQPGHGYGTENIRSIAERRGGTALFHAGVGVFSCQVEIPGRAGRQ